MRPSGPIPTCSALEVAIADVRAALDDLCGDGIAQRVPRTNRYERVAIDQAELDDA